MKQIQAWIEKHLVPIMTKITNNFWFSIVADAILYIVPFSMVSAIPSLWSILRNFIPSLPDLSPISTFSFGLIGLFVVFVIPYNCLNKIGKKDRALIAGFTGIGTYMMCMNFVTTDNGALVTMSKFGAGGMFTSMFVGLIVAAIYKAMTKFSFFGEDSVIPDFVKNWFDNIIAILLSLFIGWLLTYVAQIDVFTMVQLIMKPVTSFAQTWYGVVLIVLLQNVFYFFGISGWVFTPVTRTITQAAIAENAALVAAGAAPKNIYAYGFSRYHHIGGQGATLPLAFYMLKAKSKKYRVLGKATLVPSIFNINEPLQYGAVVGNPFMFIPTVLIAIILPGFSYLWFTLGWGTINYVNFDMNFAPNAVSAFVMSGGDWRNVLLVCINLLIAAVIWFPFFKAADKAEYKKEQELEAKKLAAKEAAELEPAAANA
jgi:PTS system cellobiose-specific IIC component